MRDHEIYAVIQGNITYFVQKSPVPAEPERTVIVSVDTSGNLSTSRGSRKLRGKKKFLVDQINDYQSEKIDHIIHYDIEPMVLVIAGLCGIQLKP